MFVGRIPGVHVWVRQKKRDRYLGKRRKRGQLEHQ